ncbi:GHMP kinase [Trichodesmium erythraeum IMS101]|uniref:GHMP kinase n=1 Tax=Trichodesmium erythraeum (strain IMS101) TaxID=203124 RepID=Q119X1_TRIEI|nr:GHMP kinase [Trichodesmium erythraeum GBRTRLIN201]
MKLFVPGRLCLFGEHSDWAGGYRSMNPQIDKGYTIVVGVDQGIYADVKPHPTHLIIKTTLNNESLIQSFNLHKHKEILLAEARRGGVFSYVAGVVYQVINNYSVGGLEIDNYFTDLPIKKGLSSSAAICVLVARAFNLLYDLKLNIRSEMELAYQGEVTTPSRCGKMDQACAYGKQAIMMIFDGEKTDIIELNPPKKDLFFVIVDLGASKDTQEILTRLNKCYIEEANKVNENVQYYLGVINADITKQAALAWQKGDGEKIGSLMLKAQIEFDKYMIPACPSQLTSPVLHLLLNYSRLQEYIWGGKGVGSQGDGTAQFIAKDENSQQKLIEIINLDFPKMQCFKLVVRAEYSNSK